MLTSQGSALVSVTLMKIQLSYT